MNKLFNIVLSGLMLNMSIHMAAFCNPDGILHLNKSYFTVEETIWFSFYGGKSNPTTWDNTLIFSLLKIKETDQMMIKSVRTSLVKGMATGYLEIPADIETGVYALCAYPESGYAFTSPWATSKIFIYNPTQKLSMEDHPSGEMNGITNIGIPDSVLPYQGLKQDQYQIKYSLYPENPLPGEKIKVSGKLEADGLTDKNARISVTVVDKRFFDFSSLGFAGSISAENRKIPNLSAEAGPGQDYTRGTLMINGKPAEIIKVYYYAYQNNKIFLDKYITNYQGQFKFTSAGLADSYDLKLFTFPDPSDTFQFRITNKPYYDSLYHIENITGNLDWIDPYIELALKQYLIRQTYFQNSPGVIPDSSPGRISDFANPSHTIILDDYIHFATLAEVIREITPQVTVNYSRNNYEVRIWDTRARNYCCNDNPLVFINTEPFLDINPVMKISTDSIVSIDIIRPIEAIRAFGDIGVNGILVINLESDVSGTPISSSGKSNFRMLGDQDKMEFESMDYNRDAPDFRSFLYWNGCIETGESGIFSFEFRNSLLPSEYAIIVSGITSRGNIFYSMAEYRTSVNGNRGK